MKFLKPLSVTLLAAAFTGSVHSAQAAAITVKGSDTMVMLSQLWAEAFMKKNPAIKVTVTGGGSGTGIAALMNNTTNLANASRDIKPEEKTTIEKGGRKLHGYKVAMDALAIVVNAKSAPVKSLTVRQLLGIYTGQINDWRQVGGKPGRIVRYCREANSGTYAFFKEHVLENKDYAPDCQTMPGTASVGQAVSKDPKGIGFGGVGYFAKQKSLKVLPIGLAPGKPAVNPIKNGKVDFPSVWKGIYPISRYLYVFKAGNPSADELKFLRFILSPEGQKLADKSDYVPMPVKKKGP